MAFWSKLLRFPRKQFERLGNIDTMAGRLYWIAKEQYLEHEFTRERYVDGKRLEPYGVKVYSQNDEDGVIQETFCGSEPTT
jgi:hypothetical protein